MVDIEVQGKQTFPIGPAEVEHSRFVNTMMSRPLKLVLLSIKKGIKRVLFAGYL